MRKIKELEERLDNAFARIAQLECDHDITLIGDGWGYYKKCSRCGKFFGYLTEMEYLEQSLKINKGKCSKESAELTKRLAELKKE